MQPFRFSIFGYENTQLPPDLKIIEQVRKVFVAKQPLAKETLFEVTGVMEDAAKCVDTFKANTCGSAFSLALINLTDSPSLMEIEFLMGGGVLGNPPTVFLATLKSLQADIYAYARSKCEAEADRIAQSRDYATPSCIDSYSASTKDVVAERVADILNAYLEDKVIRERARQTREILPASHTIAMDRLMKYESIYCGQRRAGKTGMYRGGSGTGRHAAVQSPAHISGQ